MTHLEYVRLLPCLLCGDNTATEPAHIRFGDRRAAKPQTGMGQKSGDWVVPLCSRHHREQHTRGERIWWAMNGIDPVFVALALMRVTGEISDGEQIVTYHRHYARQRRS